MGYLEAEFTLERPRRNARRDQVSQPRGRLPRTTRLMALAIKFRGMLDRREIRDCAEIARLGYVTRARMTQIMDLLTLAPQIQEELLFLPKVFVGRDPIVERDLRKIARVPLWRQQRRLWKQLLADSSTGVSIPPGS